MTDSVPTGSAWALASTDLRTSDEVAERIALAVDLERDGEHTRMPDGRSARLVEPVAYFSGRLWHACYATQVFMELGAALEMLNDDELTRVDDAVASVYWNEFGGVLLPMRLLKHLSISSEAAGAEALITQIDGWMERIGRAPSYEEGRRYHATARADLLAAFHGRVLTPVLLATGELVADCLLIQRAAAQDIRRAERERAPGQSRGDMLYEFDRTNAMLVLDASRYVMAPERMLDQLSPEAQAMASALYARRTDADLRGVLANVGPMI